MNYSIYLTRLSATIDVLSLDKQLKSINQYMYVIALLNVISELLKSAEIVVIHNLFG